MGIVDCIVCICMFVFINHIYVYSNNNYREVMNLRWSQGDTRGIVGVEGGRVDMI